MIARAAGTGQEKDAQGGSIPVKKEEYLAAAAVEKPYISLLCSLSSSSSSFGCPIHSISLKRTGRIKRAAKEEEEEDEKKCDPPI